MTLEALRDGDPRQVGPYALSGRLGDGGMGVVYLGQGPDGAQVAVKVIHARMGSDPEFRRRFAREVAAAKRVARFCTAPVLDADVEGDVAYLVTEYVQGPSLDDAVRESGPLKGSALDGLAASMAMALRAIHGAGVVHRDLKPSNVLLSQVGPKVIDFGIAQLADAEMSSAVLGTPAYMSPEQVAGEAIGPASDIFSWGGTVAFAACGRPPFGSSGSVPTILLRIVNEPPDLRGLSGPLRELVAAALAKSPAERPTAQDLMDHLSTSASGVPGRVPAGGAAPGAGTAGGVLQGAGTAAGAPPGGGPAPGGSPADRAADAASDGAADAAFPQEGATWPRSEPAIGTAPGTGSQSTGAPHSGAAHSGVARGEAPDAGIETPHPGAPRAEAPHVGTPHVGVESAGVAGTGGTGAGGGGPMDGRRRRLLAAAAAVIVAVAGVSVALAWRGQGTPADPAANGDGTAQAGTGDGKTSKTGTAERPTAAQNPLTAQEDIRFYAPEEPNASRQADAWAADRPEDAELMRKLAAVPYAIRLNEPEVRAEVENTITGAEQAGGVPVFLINSMPGSDCQSHTAAEMDAYHKWINGIAGQIGDAKAVVLLEPGGLVKMPGTENCTLPGSPDQRYKDLRQALLTLKAGPNTAVYLDGSLDFYPGAEAMSERLIAAGIDKADGFFTNTAGHAYTEKAVEYGKRLSACIGIQLVTGKKGCPSDATVDPAKMPHFIVDTARNGRGPWVPRKKYKDPQTWCNPPGRGAGARPTTDTGEELVDAYLWISRAGASSGRCRRGTTGDKDPERGVVAPEAGQWWPELALERAKLANPPLR
ncbi:protein kinase domain-containing protein [Nonomuraea sp. SYSU D8015]|uniref:protein kinase domain-containing protein n=1 Tax=Nonomuraea sp. SYSU D8015 TaxID=2593644 RepID=UPI00166174DD|nr:glycoside hydrolase family 6 protein [Nonomuraea sp. SYSU D8015]